MPTTPSLTSIEASLLHHPDRPVATSRGESWPGVTVDRHLAMPSFQMNAPALDHHCVAFVTNGAARVYQRRGGKELNGVVRMGDTILIAAGHPCLWSGASAATFRMRLPATLIEDVVLETGQGDPASAELINVFCARDLFVARAAEAFAEELVNGSHPARQLILEATSLALAAHLVRRYSASRCSHGISRNLGSKAITKALEYLNDNYADDISLASLAKYTGVSKFHFARMFKDSLGVSPMAYLEKIRLKEAESILRTGNCTLAQVARATGFSSRHYFSRRFRARLGYSPTEFARSSALILTKL
jgi:AraC family transcriptional regulator